MPIRSVKDIRLLVIPVVFLLSLLVLGPEWKALIGLGLHDDRYLQIFVAPVTCGLLLFLQRARIFENTYAPHAGFSWLCGSLLPGLFARLAGADLALTTLAMIAVWIAAFAWCCGTRSFRSARYPLSCLILMIPVPVSWMDALTRFLQYASADAAYAVLRMTPVPVYRNGMVFSIPGLDFHVGPECSGLHSSLALLMVAIVAGYLSLRSGWARVALLALTAPIAVLKNAIRIVVITVLGARVDRAFIDGPFHHRYGGAVFSVVGVVMFVAVLAGLQRLDRVGRHGRI